MKQCTKCKETKPLTEFYKSRQKGLQSWCKKCSAENTKAWNAGNREYRKSKNVEAKYGITLEEYDKAMSTSDKCEICESKEDLCYDHCHDTMKFRGVLCSKCNLGLGKLGDTLESLNRAIKYLQRAAK